MRSLEKFKGCLVGGAVGDALGYPIEFYKIEQIKNIYGKNGIFNGTRQEYHSSLLLSFLGSLSPCMGYCRAKEYDSHLRALWRRGRGMAWDGRASCRPWAQHPWHFAQ